MKLKHRIKHRRRRPQQSPGIAGLRQADDIGVDFQLAHMMRNDDARAKAGRWFSGRRP